MTVTPPEYSGGMNPLHPTQFSSQDEEQARPWPPNHKVNHQATRKDVPIGEPYREPEDPFPPRVAHNGRLIGPYDDPSFYKYDMDDAEWYGD